MIFDPKPFDPHADVARVEQFGSVNLVDCAVNGVVSSLAAATDAHFNGYADPVDLVRPRDYFEAERVAKNFNNRIKLAKASAEAKAAQSGLPTSSSDDAN